MIFHYLIVHVDLLLNYSFKEIDLLCDVVTVALYYHILYQGT